jgi:hypothetical protein
MLKANWVEIKEMQKLRQIKCEIDSCHLDDYALQGSQAEILTKNKPITNLLSYLVVHFKDLVVD